MPGESAETSDNKPVLYLQGGGGGPTAGEYGSGATGLRVISRTGINHLQKGRDAVHT